MAQEPAIDWTWLPAGVRHEADRALTVARASYGDDWRPAFAAVAPGRIELIGNHLDYNGGEVLAAAIDRQVVVLGASARDGAGVRIAFADEPDDSATLDPAALVDWRNDATPGSAADFARGVVAALIARDALDRSAAIDLAVAGNVPLGLGVSSSAALCVGLVLALASQPLLPRDIVLAAQEAEHRAGSPCGTMDQAASVGGGVIRFTGPAEWEPVEADLGPYCFAVISSGVSRSLGASSCPVRVAECREAVRLAGSLVGRSIGALADIEPAEIERLDQAGDERFPKTLLARTRHVVSEQARVRAATRALQTGDWPAFGALMTASGASSAGDYAISHPRVEALVAECLRVSGVLGARMMGGGEGGAVLALLRQDAIDLLRAALAEGYAREAGLDPVEMVHPCAFAPGAARFTADWA